MAFADEQTTETVRRLRPRVGAAAFGVALTLPLGLAGPADAMNVCACGGGGVGASQAEDPPAPKTPPPAQQAPARAPTPAPHVIPKPANPTIAVDPPKQESAPQPKPGPQPTADDRREPKPQVEPKPTLRQVPQPTADDRRRPMPQVEPEPTPKQVPQPTADDRRQPMPKVEPKPTPKQVPQPTADDRREPMPQVEPKPDPALDSDLAKLLLPPVLRDPPPPKDAPTPGRRPDRPAQTDPPQPPAPTDRLVKELTHPEPQPEPARYLSDLLLPGVDIGSEPPADRKPANVPKLRTPAPNVGVRPTPPAGRQKPGQSFADHYLDMLGRPAEPEPAPLGDRPDLRDIDPIAKDEFIVSPLSTPFYSESDREKARDRLDEDDLVVDGALSPADDRNPARNEFRVEHADPDPPPPAPTPEPSGLDNFQEVLDWGGFLPVVGAVPDVINTGIYAGRGKWTEAAWGLGGAVPFVGDAAKGVRKGRKIVHGIREAEKAADAARALDNVNDVRRVATPGSPAASTDGFLATRPKIDSSPESKSALDDIFERSQSGTRANASHPGQFTPSHTRGHSSELRTLDELTARGDVTNIRPVPAVRGSRTPDFVVTDAAGNQVRVEVTTVTGAGRGRASRGLGRAEAPTQRDIAGAINRKTSTSSSTPNQFQADLPGVPKGGTLAVHLRGGGDAATADAAVRQAASNLNGSGVSSVEIYTADRTVLRYTRGADGTFSR